VLPVPIANRFQNAKLEQPLVVHLQTSSAAHAGVALSVQEIVHVVPVGQPWSSALTAAPATKVGIGLPQAHASIIIRLPATKPNANEEAEDS
jgi:hypothetical protein